MNLPQRHLEAVEANSEANRELTDANSDANRHVYNSLPSAAG